MKQFVTALVLALILSLVACGSGSSNGLGSTNTPGNVNGNWTANLVNANGTPVFDFTLSLTQNSDNSVVGTNLTFSTATPCFGEATTVSGGVGATGNLSGSVNALFTLSVQSGPAGATGNNTLNLQGTVNNNTITGTWVVTGFTSGCSGSGNFTMTRL
jgi:hypothetical protein